MKLNKREAVIREGKILEKLRGKPFIIELYTKFKDQDQLFFVFQHCKYGTLAQLMKVKNTFEPTLARCYAAQLVEALDQIHSNGIMHRDFKPENVLVDENFRLKVVIKTKV